MTNKSHYEKDCAQLRLIAAVQYLLAGLFGLIGLLALPLFLIGVLAICLGMFGSKPGTTVSDGLITLVVAAVMLVVSGAITLLFYRTGRNLTSHRSYHFCCIVLAVQSFLIAAPGMFLGIWFAMVMNRASVKELFASNEDADAYEKRLVMKQSVLEMQELAQQEQAEDEPKSEEEHQSTEKNPRRRRGRFDNNMTGFREPEKL